MFWILLALKCFAVITIGGLVVGEVGSGTGWASHLASIGTIIALIAVVRYDLAKRRAG